MLKKVTTGSTIAVIAPAFPAKPEKTELGITYLESLGYKINRGKSLQGHFGYLSAPDEQRAHDLNDSFADPQVDAIICARGGWGGLRILDTLDYQTIAQNPKALVGYSDITTLQLAIWAKCSVASISGPMVAVEMATGILGFTEQHFWGQLNNPDKSYSIDLTEVKSKTQNQGRAEGTLLGGCLSMISHQLGTPYSPDYQNSILFLEDVGEAPYKIDRYLAHLKQGGIFNQINGLIIGEFLDCSDEDEKSFTLEEILHQYFDDLDCPVIYNFPYGHGMKKVSMPIGSKTKLDTQKGLLTFENLFNI